MDKIFKFRIQKTDINFYKLNVVFDKTINLNLDPKNYNIGLSWSGNNKYFLDQYRSIPFANFKNILNLKEINYYKLSKDKKEDPENKFIYKFI